MALINKKTGNYIRITNIRIDINTVEFNVYRDASVRDLEKNGESLEFEVIKSGSWNTDKISEVIANEPAPQGKGVLAAFKTLCYQHMLEDTAFEGWESDEN